MAAPKLDSFQKALQRFKKTLPPNLVDEFSVCSLDDVRDTCRDIQDAHGRNGTLRHMRRLEPFIEAMEQFGKVIEMFGNVNEIGPIKFLLGVTRTHINSFDKLLDVYDRIGNAIPGLLQYQTAFEKYPPLATVLEDYYADILAFHQEALSVFRRPRWKELFHSTWKTFDSKFGPILQSLKNRHELLESEKGSATLYEIQRLRQDISDIYAKERNRTVRADAEKHRREVRDIREKLEAPNYRIDQEMSTEDRHGHGSGTWIFEDPSFCSWSNKDASGHSVLYVNGIPGAEKLLEEKRDCVAYFYFKQKQPNKESHNSSLRALLLQFIERDSTVSDHLSEKMLSIESVNLRSTKVLENLVKTALETYRISYIVLDGLDECAPNEAAKSVGWFLSLINGGLAGTNVALRVLFCGQRDGMFLYARVVMENLWNQTRRSRLKEEIEPGIFPQGIEKAYERVVVRIFEMSSMAEREDAKKIMGWVICARRLLRWREIQSLFCIDPINGDVDYEERRLRVTCKELCGSLVDMHHVSNDRTSPEDVVKIVHETAREYLIQGKWLNAGLEHTRLAIFCARYLTSMPFACGINEEDITTHAVKGYYALQDYVVQFWFDHFQACAESIAELDPDIYSEAMSNAKAVLVAYGLPSKMKRLSNTQGYEEVAKTLADLPTDGYERNAYFNIEYRTTVIRNVIETLDRQALHPAVREILTNLQGNTASYKCPKPWCESFTTGFGKTEDRKQHADRHDRPFRCPSNNCFASRLGYDTRAKLDQHQKSHHPDSDNDEIRFPKMATKKKATVWTAATQGDLATISSLLDSGTGIDESNRGSPLIYIAAKSGRFEICKMLLQRGASVNLPRGHDGRTALHAAVVAGNLDIVHLLISHESCDPDRVDKYGRSPFCEACALGHLDIVKLLLGTGSIKADLQPRRHPDCCSNTSYSSPLTPLDYACGQGHLAVVQYLLQQGQSDLVSVDIITRASRQGHKDIVGLLRLIMAELGKGLSFEHAPNRFISKRYKWSVAFNPAIPLALDIELKSILPSGSRVRLFQFSDDGKHLAVECDSTVQIYTMATGKLQRIIDVNDSHCVAAVCFSPDGKYLALGWNWTIRASIMSLRFAHDSRTIVSVDSDGTAQLWDINISTPVATMNIGKDNPSSAISSDTQLIAVNNGNSIQVWNIYKNKCVWSLEDTEPIWGFAFSPNNRSLVSYGYDIIQMWSLGSLEEGLEEGSCTKTFKGRQAPLRSVAFTSDAQSVISASSDGEIRFWDSHTGETQLIISRSWGSVGAMVTSPTSNYFATTSKDQVHICFAIASPSQAAAAKLITRQRRILITELIMGEIETKKYVVAPNGDVIIHLRNFDPPFAVLPEDEALYVPLKNSIFGSAPAFGSTSAFGSTGGLFGCKPPSDSTSAFGSGGGLFGSKPPSSSASLFGSAAPSGSTSGSGSTRLFGTRAPSGSTSAFGSTGLFSSKPSSGSTSFASFGSTTPSSSTSLFGSAAPSGSSSLFRSKSPSGSTSTFGSMAPSGSTSLFGSAPSSGSTAASDSTAPSGSTPSDTTAPSDSTTPSSSTGSASSADTLKQQPQPHRDNVEHEQTRVAPQVPSEKAVNPEEQTEPSVSSPQIHLQVSSAHLKLASRYFQKAFDSKFKESQPDSDGLLHVDASGWDTEALLIVLRVIHGQNRKIPKTMDLELLAKIAVIVDYYDCHEMFDAFAELWLQKLKGRFILLHRLDRELLLLLFVSWVFGWTNEFKLATRIVLRQSKGPLRTLDLPIPEAITGKFTLITIIWEAANG
ncbi:hypothetical protein FHL15_004954 [Xylaria flabelliformis]|uniref:BTB domain-containing protein n=1 Tax=Xylaria flabelliformis TaxID=2512241 RepID=A0A553I1V2_9PEZI|nr:hypothetical protein FHL15_004954 [Xylaria flabelliformis]